MPLANCHGDFTAIATGLAPHGAELMERQATVRIDSLSWVETFEVPILREFQKWDWLNSGARKRHPKKHGEFAAFVPVPLLKRSMSIQTPRRNGTGTVPNHQSENHTNTARSQSHFSLHAKIAQLQNLRDKLFVGLMYATGMHQ